MERSWTLRLAREGDLESLGQIEAACFDEPWSPAILRAALSDPKYFLLCAEYSEHGDEPETTGASISGYVAGWLVLGEAQVDRLAVLPWHRRAGIGRALMRELLRFLEQAGAHLVFLEVRAGNIGALRLYQGSGFEVAGRRKNYYQDGEDAIVLSRPLARGEEQL